MNTRPIRLGTRGSRLARWQADFIRGQLQGLGVAVEVVVIETTGDRDQGSLSQLGGQGVFTKEIQRALLEERIDLAVHSLKDLPTVNVAGLTLAAVPPRASYRDALIQRGRQERSTGEQTHDDAASLADPLALLPLGAVVGTGSLRRSAQLLSVRPDLRIEQIRGNVETRLKKLDDGQYDALVLAEAGLARLGLTERITRRIPTDVMLPAVGQGALGLEARSADAQTCGQVASLDCPSAHRQVVAERALLKELMAGCLAPVAALARCKLAGESASLLLQARVLSHDGRRRLDVRLEGPADDPIELGKRAAGQLLSQGAAELIVAARGGGR